MIRFLLNSGGIDNADDGGVAFYQNLVRGRGDEPKIVICMFGLARSTWESKFGAYSIAFTSRIDPGVKPIFELALPDKFTEQCASADVISLSGGDDYLWQYWLGRYDLRTIWDNKTVGTNSGSSQAVCVNSWTCDWREIIGGLGVVSAKFISHYESKWGVDDPRGPINWQAAYAELAEFGDKNLPVYALKEGEYTEVVI
jgi:hypothetical protein